VSTDSVIHDIGYRRYTGRRLGRGYAVRSLYVHGVRSVFGLGRPAKSKIFPWAMVGVLVIVATVDIAIRSRTGVLTIPYRRFCDVLTLPVLLFLASIAPELLCRDLRHSVLPLYFSRPLRRSDYVWAKLAAAISGIWLLYAGPLALIFGAGLFSLNTWQERFDEARSFAGGLALAAIYAVLYASLGLMFETWLRRRMVAAAVIVGYFLVTAAVGLIVGQLIGFPNGRAIGQMFGPATLVRGLEDYLWPVPPVFNTVVGGPNGVVVFRAGPVLGPVFLAVAVALVVVSVVLLHLRYRRARS
jgi:ABC-2 type transport system permease protein